MMSVDALEMKERQVEDYFECHPDSQDIQIVGSISFPGLFDRAFFSEGGSDGVERQMMMPHVTFFSGYGDLITARETQVIIGTTKYDVREKKCDEDGSFQGQLWLI